jgi:hypothetical protein
MKWYFAVNENGLKHAWDQIGVAVDSARRNTQLTPICLVDPGERGPEATARIAALAHAGVEIIEHRASLFRIVKEVHRLDSDMFSGHWLRCDIPVLNCTDEIVLYTDIDVMFRSDPDVSAHKPAFLSCAPEHERDDWSYFNSGVMLMNLPHLRATRDELVRHVEGHIHAMGPYDDQGVLNAVYRERWDRLDHRCNWKPYWGFKNDARIVHFHGPKPGNVRNYQRDTSYTLSLEPGGYADHQRVMHTIYQRSPDGYAMYLMEADTYRI